MKARVKVAIGSIVVVFAFAVLIVSCYVPETNHNSQEISCIMKLQFISFLWNRAIGMTQVNQQMERTTGIPTSKAYLEHKVDNMIIKSLWSKLVMSKRVYLIVALLFTFQFNYAQLVEQTYSDEAENGILTQSGSFSISEAPVEFNLPNGFVYLDAKTTKSIFGY